MRELGRPSVFPFSSLVAQIFGKPLGPAFWVPFFFCAGGRAGAIENYGPKSLKLAALAKIEQFVVGKRGGDGLQNGCLGELGVWAYNGWFARVRRVLR